MGRHRYDNSNRMTALTTCSFGLFKYLSIGIAGYILCDRIKRRALFLKYFFHPYIGSRVITLSGFNCTKR